MPRKVWVLWLVLMVLRVGFNCEIGGKKESWLLNLKIPNAFGGKCFVARPRGAEGWFTF